MCEPSPLERFRAALGDRPIATPEEMHELVARNDAQLWEWGHSAVYSWITDYPSTGERVLHAGPADGVLEEIIAGVPGIENWARAAGCTQIHVTAGRPGWARIFQKLGYEQHAVVLRRILTCQV